MGYWRSSCSPYDVQANQGGRFTFDTVKERYETTKPIQGKRKEENIRPIKRRDRAWERIIKVSDDEYYITYDAYQHRKQCNRAITWKMGGGMEYMTVHTPRKMWTADMELYPRALSSSSIYWFYDFNMPNAFSMVNHRVNKYVRYDNKFYSIELGDIVFQRKQGSGEQDWQPLVVHKEFKHTLDRKRTKELRETIKPFMDYYDVMCEMVETKWEYGNPIARTLAGENTTAFKIEPEQAINLFKPKQDGSVPDEWLYMVERYKHRLTRYYYSNQHQHDKDKLGQALCNDLFCLVRPCNEVEVPIGQLCHDRYKWWYR